MKKIRWQLLIVVLALIAIAILLFSQQTVVVPGITPPTPQPRRGGSYVEALVGQFGRLNPVLDYYNHADRDIDRLIFSSLVRYDDRGSLYGDLAESWGISQDGKVYNFSIRPQATWHDGQPVTSEDILFTIDLMRDENIPLPTDIREFWKQVDVEILDEKTIQFRLPEAFAPFMDYLTFGILPSHILGDLTPEELIDDQFNVNPIGSGPYRFEKLIVDDGRINGVKLSPFEDYHRPASFIEEFEFLYYPSGEAAFGAYQNGEVMGIGEISPEILSPALKAPNLGVYTARIPRLGMVYLNLDDARLPFFQDQNIRQALLAGLNRQRIIDKYLGSQAVLANGPILPGTWAYYEGLKQVDYDPEKALRMIRDAGYTIPPEGGSVREKDGVRLEFDLIYPEESPYQEIAQAIQEDWSQLGVKANLKAVPIESLLRDYLEPHTYEAALVDLNLGRTPDPDPYPFWHQTQINGGQNYSQWNDRQASEYLEQARVEIDPQLRARLYHNFQVRFANQLPALPLYHLVYSYGVDRQVQGVRIGPLFDMADRFNTVNSWFLRSGQPNTTSATPTQAP